MQLTVLHAREIPGRPSMQLKVMTMEGKSANVDLPDSCTNRELFNIVAQAVNADPSTVGTHLRLVSGTALSAGPQQLRAPA